MIKQAENLTEFLIQLHDYLVNGEKSYFSKIFNTISGEIYRAKGRLLEQKEAIKSSDKLLSDFALKYDKDWLIADLRQAKNGEGFRLELASEGIIRLDNELIWALKKYKNFWMRWKEKFK